MNYIKNNKKENLKYIIFIIMLEIQIILQKNLQSVDVAIIGKWKGNINGGFRWKLIRDWPWQDFVKML